MQDTRSSGRIRHVLDIVTKNCHQIIGIQDQQGRWWRWWAKQGQQNVIVRLQVCSLSSLYQSHICYVPHFFSVWDQTAPRGLALKIFFLLDLKTKLLQKKNIAHKELISIHVKINTNRSEMKETVRIFYFFYLLPFLSHINTLLHKHTLTLSRHTPPTYTLVGITLLSIPPANSVP